ncbi:MAG TPA: hypothetical protein VF103_16530 [Polyangiaceae bacterium]
MSPRLSLLLGAVLAAWVASACGAVRGDASDRGAGGTATAGSSQGGASSGHTGGSAGTSHAGGDGSGGSAGKAGTSGNGTGGSTDGGRGGAGNAGVGDPDAGAAPDGGAGDAGGGAGDGDDGTTGGAGGRDDDDAQRVLVPNWSVRKRLRFAQGGDFVLEEVLQTFAEGAAAPSRIRELTVDANTARVWTPPVGTYIADFCRHASGEFSAVLVGESKTISVARLSSGLTSLAVEEIHDPAVATDPHAAGTGVTDLRGGGFGTDPARIGASGETAVVAVNSSLNSVIAYRLGFEAGVWSAPARSLLEPPAHLTLSLPIGGSFDTFGAMAAWFRPLLDVDEAGNVFVAIWAGKERIPGHVEVFHDGLAPLPGDANLPVAHADILLTKMSPNGTRLWSRVVGTEHEDEPYALRASHGFVAIVGRSRRFPGFDNSIWDALLSVTKSDGELVGTRTLPLNASGILLAVDGLPSGGFLLGGSDGWSQNPEGLSVSSYGTKLLLEVRAFDAAPIRHPLEAGPRHNEVRAVLAEPSKFWFAGHEDGPIMHTGDADTREIRATGVLGSLVRPTD